MPWNLFPCRLALILAVLLLPTVVFADHPDTRSELQNLRERIETLEAEKADSDDPFGIRVIGKYLQIGGVLELEAAYQKVEGGDDTADLVLATAELDFLVEINDHLAGHLILLHEEGETEPIEVDEAAITLSRRFDLLHGEVALTGGRIYLPFGQFNSSFISDPLTLELGETADTALLATWAGGRAEIALGTFSGEVDTVGDDDVIDSWVLALSVTPMAGITLGGSLISDLAESDIGLVTDEALYDASSAGAGLYASLALGGWSLDLEWITALEDFDAAVVAAGEDLTGDRPSAWNAELAYTPDERWLVALRAEGAEDFLDDLNRYGAVASYGLFPNTLIALEYLLGDQDGDADRSHTVTAQLAFEF